MSSKNKETFNFDFGGNQGEKQNSQSPVQVPAVSQPAFNLELTSEKKAVHKKPSKAPSVPAISPMSFNFGSESSGKPPVKSASVSKLSGESKPPVKSAPVSKPSAAVKPIIKLKTTSQQPVSFNPGSLNIKSTAPKTAEKSKNSSASVRSSGSAASTSTSQKSERTPDKSKKSGKKNQDKANQQKMIMLAGGGALFVVLVIVALVMGGGSKVETPEGHQPTAAELAARARNREAQIRAEKLRKKTAKLDAEYAAQKRGPKSEKVQTLEQADSMNRSGNLQGAAELFKKAHQLDPEDGYPVSQLVQIYRKLRNNTEVQHWEQVNSDISQGNLEQLHKRTEDKYKK